MIIAIDGPAGSGKSTIAKILANKLGYYFLNTGSFYRAITYFHLQNGLDVHNKDQAVQSGNSANLSIKNSRLCLEGEDIEDKLHLPEIDLNTSYISSHPELREIVTKKVQEIAKGINIVTEGRDTTTVIFPSADYKFYFDANVEIRAKRRCEQNNNSQDLQQVIEDIEKRDKNDKEKLVGALKISKDAIVIDTSYLTIDEVCEKIISTVFNK